MSAHSNSQSISNEVPAVKLRIPLPDYLARQGYEIADRLYRAALNRESSWAQEVALRIADCCSLQNIWTGELDDEQGEQYMGTGTLTHCNRRLCPACLRNQRSRSRKKIAERLKHLEPRSQERWRLLTLTSPTLQGALLIEVLKVYQDAWRRFRASDCYKRTIRAGVKGMEFTINSDGFHVHIHCLILSTWVYIEEFRTAWTSAMKAAWESAGFHPSINTLSGKLIIDVRLVRRYKKPPSQDGKPQAVTAQDAINEVTKYITKNDQWFSLSDADLVQVAEIRRWPRMIELLGEARGADTSLDTPRLSDGALACQGEPSEVAARDPVAESGGDAGQSEDRAPPPSLYGQLEVIGPEKWVELFSLQQLNRRRYRMRVLCLKWQFTQFACLNGDRFSYEAMEGEERRFQATKREWECPMPDHFPESERWWRFASPLSKKRYCKVCREEKPCGCDGLVQAEMFPRVHAASSGDSRDR